MQNSETNKELLARLKALASPVRLRILADLKAPDRNFPPQVDGDPKVDGICADFIRERLQLSPATTSRHLQLLTAAGVLLATRKKGWTFYKRDEAAIALFIEQLGWSI